MTAMLGALPLASSTFSNGAEAPPPTHGTCGGRSPALGEVIAPVRDQLGGALDGRCTAGRVQRGPYPPARGRCSAEGVAR
jgi:hypothetical protein